MTNIEWTDATWNPTTGCDRVSPGCDHCYALTMAKRLKGMGASAYQTDGDPRTSGPGFGVAVHADRLDDPFRWTKPRRVFVNSMSDLFHEKVPDEFIAQVFAVMAATPKHTFQVLTKRHARMRSLLRSGEFFSQVCEHAIEACGLDGVPWPLPNVWLGVSVENQQWADVRIPALLDTPAAVRFLSCEPLLGPVELEWPWLSCQHDSASGTGDPRVWTCDGCRYVWREVEDSEQGTYWVTNVLTSRTFKARKESVHPEAFVDWVIVGGESGHGARPMQAHWASMLRDQCEEEGTAFFFKQAGAVLAREWGCTDRKGHNPAEWPEPFPREFPTIATAVPA